VARAAVPGRLNWLVATLAQARQETPTARTLVLDVPGWPGHLAGQHVDVRLTAEDGYSAERSYSIASAPDGARLELTVQRIEDGEVSPYLDEVLAPGDPLELRGPIGGWFAWPPGSAAPLLLLAGGSGIVPLMSIIRTHAQVKSQVPVRLIYSARSPADVIYASELAERTLSAPLTVTFLYTRLGDQPAPPGGRRGRLSAEIIADQAWPPAARPAIFACGPSGFVEAAASFLVDAGHDPLTIKTERFGPTGT
jgi:ferredoxin-NADP reductase